MLALPFVGRPTLLLIRSWDELVKRFRLHTIHNNYNYAITTQHSLFFAAILDTFGAILPRLSQFLLTKSQFWYLLT